MPCLGCGKLHILGHEHRNAFRHCILSATKWIGQDEKTKINISMELCVCVCAAGRSVPIKFMFNRCPDRIKIHVCCGSIEKFVSLDDGDDDDCTSAVDDDNNNDNDWPINKF